MLSVAKLTLGQEGYYEQQVAAGLDDYYAGRGEVTYNGRKVQALNLPRNVLEKFYHGNAERIYGC